jgi:hypothetical protein
MKDKNLDITQPIKIKMKEAIKNTKYYKTDKVLFNQEECLDQIENEENQENRNE